MKKGIESSFAGSEKEGDVYNANVDVPQAFAAQHEIEIAVEYVLRRIKEENRGKQILFVMDAPRKDIYAGTLETSSVAFLHHIMQKYCSLCEMELLDLTLAMQKDYERNRIKFESEHDGHWDEYGHRFVSEQVYQKLVERYLPQMNP
jgi:hypothetical protein